MDLFIPSLLAFLPFIILAFVLRWIRLIKINSDIQIEQNKKIISLLEKTEIQK